MEKGPNKILLMTVIFVVLLLQFGLLFSFGATFIALLDRYGAARSQTCIVHSIFLGVGLIFGSLMILSVAGAISGALIDRIGLFHMSISACVLGPAGFILSYFALSLENLYCSTGVVAGTGVALINICCSTAIVRVFRGNQRSICLSIAYSAPAVSSVLYPNLITWFINLYGLNGTWLLIGGLFLHSWPLPVIIYFYRPMMDFHVEQRESQRPQIKTVAKINDKHDAFQNNALYDIKDETADSDKAVLDVKPGETKGTERNESYFDKAMETELDTHVQIQDTSKHLKSNMTLNMISTFEKEGPMMLTINKLKDNGVVLQSASTKNVSKVTIYQLQKKYKRPLSSLCYQNPAIRRLIAILNNRTYIFLILGASFIMGTCNAYVALVFDIADWKQFSQSQTLVLFVPYAICCTISRLAPGILERFQGLNQYIFPLTIIALAVTAQALILYTTVFEVFVIGVCLIGLAAGGTLSSVVVLSMNIVQPEQQPIATGMLFTLMGIFSTAYTPLFGSVRDQTGSYDAVSYLAMVHFIIGFSSLVVSLISSKKDKKLLQTPIYTVEIAGP